MKVRRLGVVWRGRRTSRRRDAWRGLREADRGAAAGRDVDIPRRTGLASPPWAAGRGARGPRAFRPSAFEKYWRDCVICIYHVKRIATAPFESSGQPRQTAHGASQTYPWDTFSTQRQVHEYFQRLTNSLQSLRVPQSCSRRARDCAPPHRLSHERAAPKKRRVMAAHAQPHALDALWATVARRRRADYERGRLRRDGCARADADARTTRTRTLAAPSNARASAGVSQGRGPVDVVDRQAPEQGREQVRAEGRRGGDGGRHRGRVRQRGRRRDRVRGRAGISAVLFERTPLACRRCKNHRKRCSPRRTSVGGGPRRRETVAAPGAAAAMTRIVRGDESRRRRGDDADSPWGRVATPPRLRRRYSVETPRGAAAAATWIFCGHASRRGGGDDVDSPRPREATPPRLQPG